MADGSARFVLKGGKHDGRGKKKGGFKLRVYPRVFPKNIGVNLFTPAEFDDEVEYDGEIYKLDHVTKIARFERMT